jgi:hydrogenase maturation protease
MIQILGLGNVLMGDDGFGPAAVRAFEAAYLADPEFAVIDVGTPGLDLTPWLADADRVIIVDTVKCDLPPGTLKIYDKAAVLRYPATARVGPHDPGVKETLLALEFAGREPRDLTLIGAVPERTEMTVVLSPALEAAVDPAVDAIVQALERFGVKVARREGRCEPAPWWSPEAGPHS